MRDVVSVTLKRSKIINSIRNYFTRLKHIEVDTPILAPALIPEATIEIFQTIYGNRIPLYLIPSPEIYMKKLIAEGIGNIFQITKSFRNCEEVSSLHSPEFTMLEWYTVGHTYLDSIRVIEELIRQVREDMGIPKLQYQDKQIDIDSPFEVVSMEELFKNRLSLNLSNLIHDENYMNTTLEKFGLSNPQNANWEEKFNKLFLTYIEPSLPKEKPIIIIDYPARIRTLAKTPEGADYSERWELYIAGIELANCYTEEDDPKRIKSFFEREAEEKKKSMVTPRTDEDFLKYFSNFPLTSGVAMGIDRLIMIFLDKKEIKGVIPFGIFDIIESNS